MEEVVDVTIVGGTAPIKSLLGTRLTRFRWSYGPLHGASLATAWHIRASVGYVLFMDFIY